ncbi:aminoacyl-tRNA hydrolase [Chryseobacterium caseinilyticum]|nr:hypothetical protein [Chryseobacterium caseinilyticum]
MYILIKDNVPDKLVPVITAHASLSCYLKFETDENMRKWISGIFKKVVCVVNEAEFENFKNEENHIVLTESSLDHREVCIAFCPREEYPKKFKFLKMWTPQNI